MKIIFKVTALAGGLAALPMTFDPSAGRIVANNACADSGGSCCFESGSTCYPNNCSDASCREENKYWNSSGSKCN